VDVCEFLDLDLIDELESFIADDYYIDSFYDHSIFHDSIITISLNIIYCILVAELIMKCLAIIGILVSVVANLKILNDLSRASSQIQKAVDKVSLEYEKEEA